MVKTFRYENDVNEFSANTYVVGEKGGTCIVIDLGSTADRVIKYIKANFTGCSGVLLTHGHWDHIRGLPNFLDSFPNTTVFIDELDSELLINPNLNCSKSMDKSKGVVNVAPYELSDGDELKFGSNLIFKVIETPFHTLGSVCYECDAEKALFTGDTLFKGDIGRSDLPHSDHRLIKESLAKIKALDPKLHVYPGHGDDTVLEKEFIQNNYLK